MKGKSQWGAAFLNLIIPGVGYIYVGAKRQTLSIGMTVATVATYMSPAYWRAEFDPALIIGSLVFAAVFAIDAYRDAETLNQSLSAGSA